MFEAHLDTVVDLTDQELTDALRANEAAARTAAAERAALIAVAEQRGIWCATHRSAAGWLRAELDCGDGTITADRKLARLLDAHPAVGDALMAGRFSVDHAHQIARIHTNPRIANLLGTIVPVLVDLAEHRSYAEFRGDIDELIAQLDADGAFADLADNIDKRTAHVTDLDGCVVIDASGGDPIQAAQLVAIFESFVDGEYQRDLAQRRSEHPDDPDQWPLPRTPGQRRFDALVAIFAAAAASPERRALPEPTVGIVIDQRSVHEAFTHAGIMLPSGDMVDDQPIDADPDNTQQLDQALNGLAEALVDDPDVFLDRRCETSTGSKIHPLIALRALLTGHVRRVVVDSRGHIIDYGTKQRLFTGPAREAALLLATTCAYPGCRLPARMCQVDHNQPWSTGGPTNQTNATPLCGVHNRIKHRDGLTITRDHHGRPYTQHPDGTIILPVGERPPDLTPPNPIQIIRFHIDQLRNAA